ncbi:MAG TPA: hypothetical protein VFQ56_08720 [Flavobacterium sp.]|nr:hypothetical protein [Flavobacterium sp.]
MNQEVKSLKLKDLVLWTENPRDPIDPKAKDQDIVNNALGDRSEKWALSKLAVEMGDYYDLSELPTVVFHGKKPVVYDGNRRVILGKMKLGLVKSDGLDLKIIPSYPTEIPCNVCDEETALKNVLRKHGDSGSWQPLERDIFLNKYMHQPKSAFLLIEENTGLISSQPLLNQRFVKDEILKESNLKEMGFEFKGETLCSVHNQKQAREIFDDLSQKIVNKQITTRTSRYKVIEVLDKKSQTLIDTNKENALSSVQIDFKSTVNGKGKKTKPITKRKAKKEVMLFGSRLYLEMGDVNDLHRDIVDLYQFYIDNSNRLSPSFTSLVRMALRLLCETAAHNSGQKMDDYIKAHFANAKKTLSTDFKTSLSNHNVTETSILKLLHTGAHGYSASKNLEQTIAISIILGAMLMSSHRKTV